MSSPNVSFLAKQDVTFTSALYTYFPFISIQPVVTFMIHWAIFK